MNVKRFDMVVKGGWHLSWNGASHLLLYYRPEGLFR